MIPLILSYDSLALLCFGTIASNKYWSGFYFCLFFGGLDGFHCKSDALFCSGVCFLERSVIVAPFLEWEHHLSTYLRKKFVKYIVLTISPKPAQHMTQQATMAHTILCLKLLS